MGRGLDHIVHVVRDLDAAAELYKRLGFQVGARNRHAPAWGTQNHIVQLSGTFIELLAVTDRTGIAPHAPRHFSFGAFNRDFVDRWEGLSMLVLEGRGGADADAFRAAGIGDFELYEFEREAKRPDGTPIKVAFELAFAADRVAPDIGFFTCQQRYPENFWNSAFQIHPNGATHVAGVVMVAANPNDHQEFLSAFSGARERRATSECIMLKTSRGEIQVMTPGEYRNNFGVASPDISRGAKLAGIRLAMRDLGGARSVLRTGGINFSEPAQKLVVGPGSAMGATIIFEAAA